MLKLLWPVERLCKACLYGHPVQRLLMVLSELSKSRRNAICWTQVLKHVHHTVLQTESSASLQTIVADYRSKDWFGKVIPDLVVLVC